MGKEIIPPPWWDFWGRLRWYIEERERLETIELWAEKEGDDDRR